MTESRKLEEIEEQEENLFELYHRAPLAIERGDGVYLYDVDGKEYLDFTAGIAVMGLGYHYPGFDEALKDQIDKITHTSNLYYNENSGPAAKALSKASQMEKIFFTNSGTEAIEGAMKTARKYADVKQSGRYQFIAMEDSFHGRTLGALSVTGTKEYRDPFEPLIPGALFARFNDLDSVKALVNDKTCAIILEPLQGEGGVHAATPEFMQGIRKICDENDILMICDEIQCGMGRTGYLFSWQEYGTKPDIMTMAKAIGNGMPVGAFAVNQKVADHSMKPGDHGTTYGGNPLACMAVKTVLDIFEKDQIVDHVRKVGSYLWQKLEALMAEHKEIAAHRGKGLIQGLEFVASPAEVISRALDEGLVLTSAKGNVIRFIPPLIVEEKQVDEMIEKLERSLGTK